MLDFHDAGKLLIDDEEMSVSDLKGVSDSGSFMIDLMVSFYKAPANPVVLGEIADGGTVYFSFLYDPGANQLQLKWGAMGPGDILTASFTPTDKQWYNIRAGIMLFTKTTTKGFIEVDGTVTG